MVLTSRSIGTDKEIHRLPRDGTDREIHRLLRDGTDREIHRLPRDDTDREIHRLPCDRTDSLAGTDFGLFSVVLFVLFRGSLFTGENYEQRSTK